MYVRATYNERDERETVSEKYYNERERNNAFCTNHIDCAREPHETLPIRCRVWRGTSPPRGVPSGVPRCSWWRTKAWYSCATLRSMPSFISRSSSGWVWRKPAQVSSEMRSSVLPRGLFPTSVVSRLPPV